jgi:RNA polymerase sigma-70 factor (ECF subfamily)
VGVEINKDLIERCIKNNRKAQEQLYQQFYGPMWSLCMRYVGNKEETLEVVNDGFLKVFQNLHKYNDNLSGFNTWINRIMINAAIDFIRKKKALKFLPVEELHELHEQPVDDIPDKYTAQQIVYFINQLPQTTKLVFNLYTIEGYSHEEIAAFLKISNSTSRWHLSDARKQLREIIKKNG